MTKSKFGVAPEVGHHYRVRIHDGDDIVRVFEGEEYRLPTIEFCAVVQMIVPDLDGQPMPEDEVDRANVSTVDDWIYFDNGVLLRRWDNVTFEDAPHERGAGWHYTSST